MKIKHKALLDNMIILLPDIEAEKVTDGGLIIPETLEEKKREQGGHTIVEVLDIGPCCWQGFYDENENRVKVCEVGDSIMMAAYAGQKFPVDDTTPKKEQDYMKRVRLVKDVDALTLVGDE